MQFDWRLFITSIGLAFVLEGIPYFLFAERLPGIFKKLSEQPPGFIRILGALAALTGLLILFLVRRLF